MMTVEDPRDEDILRMIEMTGFVGVLLKLLEKGGEIDVADLVKSRHHKKGIASRYCIDNVTEILVRLKLAEVIERRSSDGRGGKKHVLLISGKGRQVAQTFRGAIAEMHSGTR